MDLRVMTAEKSAQSEEYRRIWFGAPNKQETVFQRFAQHEENRKEKLQLRANIYSLTDHLKHSTNELFAKEARHDDSGISLERPSSSRSSSASGSPTASALSPSIATTCAPPGKPESLDDSTREDESPSPTAAAGPSLAAVCSTTQRGHHHHFRCAMCGLTDFEDVHSFFQHCSDHQETKLSVPHLNCSICSQALLSKESLLAHLLTDHMEPDKQCRRCNFHTEDMDEAEAHRFACYNVQRKKGKKRKQSRCQKCKATAPNKWELYKHNIAHVNMSRALYCDFCPFVTDLKHHMEYHTFNHSGTKPLKCTQCTYTCVNKAMLKSHMKIHSNICDFQCNDCTYQAKYHTVLKKHLQETKHSQKITYFPDGSQVQMIDVMGSKRGPKAATTSLKPPRETVTSRRTAAQPYNRPTMVNNEPLANMLMLPLPILKCHNCEFITSNEFALLKHNYERHSVVSRQVAAAILMEQIRAMQVAANQFAGGTINLRTSPQTLEDSEKEEKMEAEPTTENDNDGANQVAAKQVWSCRDCDMHFLESNKFLIHMGYHSAPDKFTCRLCGQKTGNRNAFIFHVGNHDPRH